MVRLCWVYIGIMEKKMETTIVNWVRLGFDWDNENSINTTI